MTPHAASHHSPKATFGAYALTPSPDADGGRAEQDFYAGLATLPIDVIEFPLTPEGAPNLTPDWINTFLQPEWDLMITCIPRTMARLSGTPSYGLASADPAGRAAALADIRQARDLAAQLAEESGRSRVVALEVHSAPGPERGSVAAFTESLTELLRWDFAGAELIVEHCDALVPGQSPAKGFLTLEDEIAAVRAALEAAGAGARSRLGVGINWGRSAIEGRSAATPAEHIHVARDAGLLRSIIFSGAGAEESAWGAPWADTHMAPRGEDPALAPSSASLLGDREIEAAFAAADGSGLAFVGPKITAQPASATAEERLALARASLAQTTSVALRASV